MSLCVEISRLESKSREFLLLVQQSARPKQIRRFAVDVLGVVRVYLGVKLLWVGPDATSGPSMR